MPKGICDRCDKKIFNKNGNKNKSRVVCDVCLNERLRNIIGGVL